MIDCMMGDIAKEEKEICSTYPKSVSQINVIQDGEYKLQVDVFFRDYYKKRRKVLRKQFIKDWIKAVFFLLFGLILFIPITFIFTEENVSLSYIVILVLSLILLGYGWILVCEGYKEFKTFHKFTINVHNIHS